MRPIRGSERALDVLFILHADHEQNCSTSAVRSVGSSQVDPYTAVAAGDRGAVRPFAWRCQRGRAADAATRSHRSTTFPISSSAVKAGEQRLMGFGQRGLPELRSARQDHRKGGCEDLLKKLGMKDPLLDIAKKLEEVALKDDYFLSRKLYPNVDFYSGLIMRALGLPVEMFPVLFAIRANKRLGSAMVGDDRRPRTEDRATPADLHRPARTRVRTDCAPHLRVQRERAWTFSRRFGAGSMKLKARHHSKL